MDSLPKSMIVCVKSEKNNKYLRYKNDQTETHSLVQFDGQDVMDPFAQFEIVESEIGGDLVHIKCCYTNSYLVRWSRSHYWISASADEPVEDQTTWGCTLFEATRIEEVGHTTKIRLLHVQLGRYVRLPNTNVSTRYVSCLLADSKEPDYENRSDVLNVINLKLLFKLPKRVAFKGDNGLYLGAQLCDGLPGLQFSFNDASDPKVAQEIIHFPNGTISVKSEYYGSFWRVERDIRNVIVVDADGPNSDTGTFRVIPIGINVFALLSMYPTSYLRRLDGNDVAWNESIAAATQAMDKYARMEVVDLGDFEPLLQELTTVHIKIRMGDITQWSISGSSDAIVNPTNERMLADGGVDRAIHIAAGPELKEACAKVPEVHPGVRCPTGEARITPGFKLPASRVIHTVSPIYDVNKNPAQSLRNAYRNSLHLAKQNNIRYIAFPAISCGVHGYPVDEAAEIAISTVKEFANDFNEVHFVLFSDDKYRVWVEKAKEIIGN